MKLVRKVAVSPGSAERQVGDTAQVESRSPGSAESQGGDTAQVEGRDVPLKPVKSWTNPIWWARKKQGHGSSCPGWFISGLEWLSMLKAAFAGKRGLDWLSKLNKVAFAGMKKLPSYKRLVAESTFVVFLTLCFFHGVHCGLVAGFILLTVDPECMGGRDGNTSPLSFAEAYHLAFTTLSTVGYRGIYPKPDIECFAINAICNWGTFSGVMFGAFGWNTLNDAHAKFNLIFCDKICIRFPAASEFPVIKFLIVNGYGNREENGIWQSNVGIVCSKKISQQGDNSKYEDASMRLAECLHFLKPWEVCHVVDQHSPLLASSAREEIELNGGKCPEHWSRDNSFVEQKFDFESMVLVFTGTLNCGKTVFSKKIYDKTAFCSGSDFSHLVKVNEGTKGWEIDFDEVHNVVPIT